VDEFEETVLERFSWRRKADFVTRIAFMSHPLDRNLAALSRDESEKTHGKAKRAARDTRRLVYVQQKD
jgi:hypothetical protein